MRYRMVWCVILLEFDFSIVVKLGKTHLRADNLSRITSGELPVRVDDDLPDAFLFHIEKAPRWAEPILTILMTRFLDTMNCMQEAILELEKSKPYKKGSDEVLCLCINLDEYIKIIHHAMLVFDYRMSSFSLPKERKR